VIKKSYKKACQPTINDASRTRMQQALKKSALFCCNSAECNKEIVTSGIADPVIQCYTCDSRITGLQGCSIFNQSNPYVYKAGSSSHNEQCAVSCFFLCLFDRSKSFFRCKTIFGEAGKDSVTKKAYPAFTIRTFVHKCVSKSGTVSYGGATFRGRIDCCSTDLCNSKNMNDKSVQSKVKRFTKLGLFLGSIILISIVIGIIVGFVLVRHRQKKTSKDKIKYDQCQTTDEVQLRLNKIKQQQLHQTDSFPDPTSSP